MAYADRDANGNPRRFAYANGHTDARAHANTNGYTDATAHANTSGDTDASAYANTSGYTDASAYANTSGDPDTDSRWGWPERRRNSRNSSGGADTGGSHNVAGNAATLRKPPGLVRPAPPGEMEAGMTRCDDTDSDA